MHENAWKWISLIFFVWGLLGLWYFITEPISLSNFIENVIIIIFGFGYGYHLRTNKRWGFKKC